MTDSVSDDRPRSSPLSGCIILIVTIVVFGGLIVLYTTVGLWMNRQIEAFTSENPIELPIPSTTPAQTDAVMAKLKELQTAAEANEIARVLFTVEDLNALFATLPLLEDYKGKASIQSITTDGIFVEMTQQMRALMPGQRRYLNATFLFKPEASRKTVIFAVRDIAVPGKEVPAEFVNSYSSQDLFRLDVRHEVMGPVLKKIDRAYTEEGVLVIETRADLPPTGK